MLVKIFKKIIPFSLILAIVMTGFFSTPTKAEAVEETSGTCKYTVLRGNANVTQIDHNMSQTACESKTGSDGNKGAWSGYSASNPAPTENSNDFAERIGSCGLWSALKSPVMCGLLNIIYFFFVTVPGLLLVLAAKMFNFVTALTLDADMYRAPFIAKIWVIVRDFTNIFFILILLYAAIQIILDLGHGQAKKIVASVIMVALLVNFSLFFTKVVIDASNITALIFYNKIDTSKTPDKPVGANGERDMAGALVSRFNPNSFFGGTFFDELNEDPVIKNNGISLTFKMGLILVYGIVLYALIYAFFIGALSMFGRMLTLMMLLIISPFAFVTKAVPKLSGVESIGFKSWLKKLLQTSFMAVVFIFIIYIISEILNANPFSVTSNSNTTATGKIVVLFMPAILIVILLLKGAKYAKSASGEFTDMVMKGAGFAGGAAMGGAAILGTGLIGGGAKALAGKYGERLKGATGNKGFSGFAARTALKSTNYAQKASFDLRQAPGIGALSAASGVNFNSGALKGIGLGPKQGGLKAKIEAKEKALKEESKLYETSMDNEEVKAWSKARMDKYEDQKKEAEKEALASGRTFDGAKYEKENKPKEYTSADQLNHDRIKAFQDTLGIDGLLGSVMYSTVGQWAGGTEQEKKARALKAKRRVGGVAAVLTGGALGGAVVPGIIGGAGIGGALGAGYAVGYAGTEGAGEKKFIKDYAKEHGKVGKIEARMKQNEDIIEGEKKYLDDVRGDGVMIGDTPGKDLVTADGKVNQEKIQELLSNIVFQEQKANAELQALSNKIITQGGIADDKDADIERRIRTAMIETASVKNKLTTLKTSPERTLAAQRDNDRLSEIKDKIHDKAHATEQAHKPAEPAASHPAPVTHTPAPSGGGHDTSHGDKD